MSEFVSAAPPSGGFVWADHKGKLLVIEPLAVEVGIQTSFGETDAVRANIYVLTGEGASEDYEDSLVFPKVLVGQLRRQVGSKVVGRLTQGAAKPSQSAPWLLSEATPEDIAKAEAWVKSNATSSVTSAAAPF